MTEDDKELPFAFGDKRYATELESVEAAYQHCLNGLATLLLPSRPDAAKEILERFVELTSMRNRLRDGVNIMPSTSPEGQREPIDPYQGHGILCRARERSNLSWCNCAKGNKA